MTDETYICVGMCHRTAPASVRELAAVSRTACDGLLDRATATGRSAVVLSTCGRIELYTTTSARKPAGTPWIERTTSVEHTTSIEHATGIERAMCAENTAGIEHAMGTERAMCEEDTARIEHARGNGHTTGIGHTAWVEQSARAGDVAWAVGALVGAGSASLGAWMRYGRVYHGDAAVRHVFALACGLESPIVGECQVFGQLRRAVSAARARRAVTGGLDEVLSRAIRCGRRARRETAIETAPTALAELAVSAAVRRGGSLSRCSIAIVGSGDVATSVVRVLMRRCRRRLTVIARGSGAAARLVRLSGGEVVPFAGLGRALETADVMFTATRAPHAVIRRGAVADAMAHRRDRPLWIADLAFPRDVEPLVGAVPGVALVDLDGVYASMPAAPPARRATVRAVERIVDEEVARLAEHRAARRNASRVIRVRRTADAVRVRELDALFRDTRLDAAQRAAVNRFSRRLMNKLMHERTVAARRAEDAASDWAGDAGSGGADGGAAAKKTG
ncbi:MAG: glutamyl-tRNA reductase [Phycisphaerae bacterium]